MSIETASDKREDVGILKGDVLFLNGDKGPYPLKYELEATKND